MGSFLGDYTFGFIFGYPLLPLFLSKILPFGFPHIITIEGRIFRDLAHSNYYGILDYRFNFVFHIINLVYCYFISCLLIWAYDRYKIKKSTPLFSGGSRMMKSKIIGIIGGIITLFGAISPWLIIRGGETLYGFLFGLLFIITISLGFIGIITSLIGKKTTWIIASITGISLIIWSKFLELIIFSIGAKFIWMKYDAEWLGWGASSFANVSYGIYVIMIGGVIILLGSILGLKEEVFLK
jgi:hypothetical protein